MRLIAALEDLREFVEQDLFEFIIYDESDLPAYRALQVEVATVCAALKNAWFVYQEEHNFVEADLEDLHDEAYAQHANNDPF